jgi:hypothetical protein
MVESAGVIARYIGGKSPHKKVVRTNRKRPHKKVVRTNRKRPHKKVARTNRKRPHKKGGRTNRKRPHKKGARTNRKRPRKKVVRTNRKRPHKKVVGGTSNMVEFKEAQRRWDRLKKGPYPTEKGFTDYHGVRIDGSAKQLRMMRDHEVSTLDDVGAGFGVQKNTETPASSDGNILQIPQQVNEVAVIIQQADTTTEHIPINLKSGNKWWTRIIPLAHSTSVRAAEKTIAAEKNKEQRKMKIIKKTKEGLKDYIYRKVKDRTYSSDGELNAYVHGELNAYVQAGIKESTITDIRLTSSELDGIVNNIYGEMEFKLTQLNMINKEDRVANIAMLAEEDAPHLLYVRQNPESTEEPKKRVLDKGYQEVVTKIIEELKNMKDAFMGATLSDMPELTPEQSIQCMVAATDQVINDESDTSNKRAASIILLYQLNRIVDSPWSLKDMLSFDGFDVREPHILELAAYRELTRITNTKQVEENCADKLTLKDNLFALDNHCLHVYMYTIATFIGVKGIDHVALEELKALSIDGDSRVEEEEQEEQEKQEEQEEQEKQEMYSKGVEELDKLDVLKTDDKGPPPRPPPRPAAPREQEQQGEEEDAYRKAVVEELRKIDV